MEGEYELLWSLAALITVISVRTLIVPEDDPQFRALRSKIENVAL